MEIKKEMIEDISKRWFGDHKAELSVYRNEAGREISVLDWRKPGTGVFAVRYIMDGYYLHVTGDCGDALYQLTEKAELKKIAHYEMRYLYGKSVCIGDDGIDYSPNEAVEAIQEYVSDMGDDADWNEDDMEIINDTIEEAKSAITREDWHQRLAVLDYRHNLDNVFSDWYEWLYDCGDCYSYHAVAFWLGLRMAYKQLSESGKIAEEEK